MVICELYYNILMIFYTQQTTKTCIYIYVLYIYIYTVKETILTMIKLQLKHYLLLLLTKKCILYK